MRLDKWLSDATSYTRSQLKQLIRSGQVTVNQTIVKKPETPVQETDVICLQGNPVEPAESCYCLLLNKPLGYVCAVTDATEKTVMELIPPELQRKGLFPVGRLDKDTSGMLLLTNDGAFSHALLAPKRHVPKYYRMQLARPYEESYAQQLAEGLVLADGTHCLPAEILPVLNTDRMAVICLHEGKYHQVRRDAGGSRKPCGAVAASCYRKSFFTNQFTNWSVSETDQHTNQPAFPAARPQVLVGTDSK